MTNTLKTSVKTKTAIALSAGLIVACAGVIAPTAAQANSGTMCQTLGAGLDQDPVTSGQLQVVGVRKLFRPGERHMHNRPIGAAISLLAAPGTTAADLQRAAACHAGANHATSPLGVDGVKVRVEREGSKYVLYLTADTRSAALEIQHRAQAAQR